MRYPIAVLVLTLSLSAAVFGDDAFKLSVDATTLPTQPTTEPAGEPQTLRERREYQNANILAHLSDTLSPYQPVYFLVGPEDPIAKFQISFKYQFVPDKSDLGKEHPWITPFYVAYSQTSFWDLGESSAPFFDNSYRPEFFWLRPDLFAGKLPDNLQFGFQTGLQHESNGQAGDDSRSMNSVYIEPQLTFGLNKDWFLEIKPRVYFYFDTEGNEDITDYRGFTDLKVTIGEYEGLQASFIGRLGEYGDKGSLEADFSYPLIRTFKNSPNLLCLHLQVFTGYGETLVDYNESDTSVRLGVSLVR